MRLARQSFLALLLGLLLCGCGRTQPMGEVEGTIKAQGKPLRGIEIQFLPDYTQGTTGPYSTAVTDADGHYQLRCSNGKSGAVVGHHQVRLRDLVSEMYSYKQGKGPKQDADDDDDAPPSAGRTPGTKKQLPRIKIPPEYSMPSERPVRREVVSGPQRIDLDLTSPGKP